MYSLIKPLLFCLNPERAHAVTLKALQFADGLGLTKFFPVAPENPCRLFGLDFPNRIGLAAGMDKNGEYVDALAALGFGFIEVGTVTPKPQAGNAKPRLFRLVKEEAIINRLGFNNKGMEYMAAQLAKCRYRGVLGINIGKNRDTPNEDAISDYLLCFRRLWPYAGYITVNVSSPNTAGLRDLQNNEALNDLLSALKNEQRTIATAHQKYVPLLVKISPDLSPDELEDVASILLKQQMDGVIATNTTLRRDGVQGSIYVNEAGGVSGRPLTSLNTDTIQQLSKFLQNKIPIIAVGGVMDKASAQEKISAGASLLQVYTGLIYRGPHLIKELL
jgi:dihydroorotate dehydrogenase